MSWQLMDVDRLTPVERENLRAAAARNLLGCCDWCRDLLRVQLSAEENCSQQSWAHSASVDPIQRLHRSIRACTRCADAGYIPVARPVVAGKLGDRIAIIGQAPGAVELTTGQPFSGRSGAILRRWLGDAGISESDLPYRTAITKCFPGKAIGGVGDRRPSPAEVQLCAPWLDAELEILRPRVLVLLGTLAIYRFWGKAPLEEAVGRRRRESGRVLLPFPHPSGASRWLNDPAHAELLAKAIRLLRREAAHIRA